MNRLLDKIIPVLSIVWCSAIIIDRLLGNQLGLSFIYEDWASMTVGTAALFILLFAIRMSSASKINIAFLFLLGILAIADFSLGIIYEERTHISTIATSLIFLLFAIQGYYFEKGEKLYLRFAIKFVVYTTSTAVLILYFLEPDNLYTLPGFEAMSWNTAIGFLLYSSTLLPHYYGRLIENANLPEDFTILNKKFVNFWFTTSFLFPVFVIITISLLHFVGALTIKSGMALALFVVCMIPFPLTYLIHLETVDWSVTIYNKNKKLFHREQDIKFHNELLQEFAQITSHNLRAPIHGLQELTEMVLDEDASAEQRERSFQLFSEKLPSLVNTVDSLADFYKMIRAGEIAYEQCDIREYFEEALTSCRNGFEIEAPELTVEFDLASPAVEYPGIYFKNLAYNLVSNAIKYRDEERPLHIRITTEQRGPVGTELTFWDNGIGMNLEYFKNKIFKFGSSYHNHPNSSGISLFIIYNQLARLGDSIDVDSVEGEFTEFTILLNRKGKKELGYG